MTPLIPSFECLKAKENVEKIPIFQFRYQEFTTTTTTTTAANMNHHHTQQQQQKAGEQQLSEPEDMEMEGEFWCYEDLMGNLPRSHVKFHSGAIDYLCRMSRTL